MFGASLAILAGDALQALGLQMVVDDPGPGRAEISSVFAEAIGLVLAGQAREFTVRLGPDTGIAEYDRIVEEKTSALLECALVTPALRAGKPEHVLTALRGAGRHLGLAFQIFNDVEDIWGDPAVTGKPVRSDILRRNPSCPVLVALSADSPAGERLRRCGTPTAPRRRTCRRWPTSSRNPAAGTRPSNCPAAIWTRPWSTSDEPSCPRPRPPN